MIRTFDLFPTSVRFPARRDDVSGAQLSRRRSSGDPLWATGSDPSMLDPNKKKRDYRKVQGPPDRHRLPAGTNRPPHRGDQDLTEHLRSHKKDHSSRRGLIKKVGAPPRPDEVPQARGTPGLRQAMALGRSKPTIRRTATTVGFGLYSFHTQVHWRKAFLPKGMAEAVIMNLENTSIVPTQMSPDPDLPISSASDGKRPRLVPRPEPGLRPSSLENTAPYLAAAQTVLAFFRGLCRVIGPRRRCSPSRSMVGSTPGSFQALFKLGNAADICAMLHLFRDPPHLPRQPIGGIAASPSRPRSRLSGNWRSPRLASLSLVSIAVGGSFLRQLRSAHAITVSRPTYRHLFIKTPEPSKTQRRRLSGEIRPHIIITIHTGAVLNERRKPLKRQRAINDKAPHPCARNSGPPCSILIFIYSEPKNFD